jgi:hypothetical protein
VAPGKGGARILACNKAARRQGLAVGDLLSNARSKVLDLQARDADPAADALPVKMVTASRGKHVRAEPVALLYEQGKVRHLGAFAELEDQMCAMRPDGYAGDGSPDRLDALVWAVTELSAPRNVAYIIGGGGPIPRLGAFNQRDTV